MQKGTQDGRGGGGNGGGNGGGDSGWISGEDLNTDGEESFGREEETEDALGLSLRLACPFLWHQWCTSQNEVQSRPLVWSTDVRSTRLYGQFLGGSKQIGHFVSEKAHLKVRKSRLHGQFRSIWSKFDKENDFIWG